MKHLLFILLTLFAFNVSSSAKAFDLIVTPSHDEEEVKTPPPADKPLLDKKLLVVVSSGEIEKAGMGLTLGLSAAKKGAKVSFVLGAKALSFAKEQGKQHTFLAKGMTPRAILQEAQKHHATIMICGMCAKALGLGEKDFIEGTKIVTSKTIFKTMYEEGMKTLSF